MMPFNYILRECTGSDKFIKPQEKVNHIMYMNDITIFVKNEEQEILIQTIRINNQDIGMEFDIEKCAMLIMK